MQSLRPDDPRECGPYVVVGRLDDAVGFASLERHFIARTADGNRTVLLTLPSAELSTEEGHRERFRSQAVDAQRIGGSSPWLEAPEAVAGPEAQLPWRAAPYLPALSLPGVLGTHGAPLPAHSVYAVGAALAEALAALHAQGFAHSGVSPLTVHLTATGPRLTGFGAVRTVGPDGQDRSELPGVLPESVAPEQLTGGRPRPLGDMYALGAVLAYAATGHMSPERNELPAGLLRDLVSRCLAREAARRPQAAQLVEELLPGTVNGGGYASSNGVGAQGTVLDTAGNTAAALLTPGWLPKRTSAALGVQAASVLAAETDPEFGSSADAVDIPETAACDGHTGAGEQKSDSEQREHGGVTTVPAVVRNAFADPTRRRMLTVAASGTTGLAVGGAVTWAATADQQPSPTAAQRLTAARRTTARLKGAPPTPRWRYNVPGPAPRFPPVIHRDGIAVVVNDEAACGLSLRTGEVLWREPKTGMVTGPAKQAAGHLVLVPGHDVLALDVRTGDVRWRSKEFSRKSGAPYVSLLAVDDSTFWFTAKNPKASSPSTGEVVVAVDLSAQREQWRSPVPAGFNEAHLFKNRLVLTTPGESSEHFAKQHPREFIALDRHSGSRERQRALSGVAAGQFVATGNAGRLVAAEHGRLRGYDLVRGGAAHWTVQSKGQPNEEKPPFGLPVLHGATAVAADALEGVHAVNVVDGEVKWQSDVVKTEGWHRDQRRPGVLVSPSGHLIVTTTESGINAHEGRSGELLWRFLDLPHTDRPARGWRSAALNDTTAVVVSQDRVYALPLT